MGLVGGMIGIGRKVEESSNMEKLTAPAASNVHVTQVICGLEMIMKQATE